MNSLNYRKVDLIEKIRANRDNHRAIFTEAMDGYLKEARFRLRLATTAIREGKVPDFYALVQLPVPEDHTKDYDAVLAMLDLTIGDSIEVSERDFRSYVLDEWTWKREFLGTASSYTASAR